MPTSNHPKALPFLFLTELWERFGFYIVQGLLILYMTQYFSYSDSQSYTILGVFTALAYISPLAGGYVANHILDYKTTILWGGLFLTLGYVLLSLSYNKILLYPALATIIVGNGLFKPNISSLLGSQYDAHDPKRDAGFTIFYIGINIGAFLAGLSSGYIKNLFGWQISFTMASFGLIIGLITFLYGLKYIKTEKKHLIKINTTIKNRLLLICFLAIIALTFLLKVKSLADFLLPVIGLILLCTLTYIGLQQTAIYRKNMLLLASLILSSIVFWMLFFQIFYSANLFIDRLVNKQIFHIPLTTTFFYGLEGIYIILLGPCFAWLWNRLNKHQSNPSALTKFSLGLFFAGLGFILLGISVYYPNSHGLIHPAWIFCSYFLITIGELFLSPIGLSAVTLLAPPSLVGLMMGVWFVATGFGGMFAGWLAQFANVPATIIQNSSKLIIYQTAFFNYAYIAFFVSALLFLIQLIVKRYQA